MRLSVGDGFRVGVHVAVGSGVAIAVGVGVEVGTTDGGCHVPPPEPVGVEGSVTFGPPTGGLGPLHDAAIIPTIANTSTIMMNRFTRLILQPFLLLATRTVSASGPTITPPPLAPQGT